MSRERKRKKVASGLIRFRLQLTFNDGELELVHELPFVPSSDVGLFGLPGLDEGEQSWGFFRDMMEWRAVEKEFLVLGHLSADIEPSDKDWTQEEQLDGKFADRLRAAGWE